MTKRDEEIGRAAYIASMKAWRGVVRGFSEILWDNVVQERKAEWINEALAAVSRAREIDTCETCEHKRSDHVMCHIGYYTGGQGCNRHQPKDET